LYFLQVAGKRLPNTETDGIEGWGRNKKLYLAFVGPGKKYPF
jgi:hypothetical protein